MHHESYMLHWSSIFVSSFKPLLLKFTRSTKGAGTLHNSSSPDHKSMSKVCPISCQKFQQSSISYGEQMEQKQDCVHYYTDPYIPPEDKQLFRRVAQCCCLLDRRMVENRTPQPILVG